MKLSGKTLNCMAYLCQAAQIELDARQLNRCQTVEAISHIGPTLSTSELIGPASNILRKFSYLSRDVGIALNQVTNYHQRLAFNGIEKELNTLELDLTRSSEPYAVRFYPIAIQWRQLVADHAQTLTQTIEQRQELENPYIFGTPITEQQDIFVGRADIVARIEELLLDPSRPPLLLYGQRRMGKTSLLYNLRRMLPQSIVPLFVDGEGVSGATDYPDLLYNITQEMGRSANHARLKLPQLSYADLSHRPFTTFNEWLDRVEQRIDEAGRAIALLMLDEFEALDSVMERGRFEAHDFFRLLRHLIQHRPRFKLLLAGSHTLEEFQRWASYLINMHVLKISYLDEPSAIRLIEHPVKAFALQYTPQASQRILELTARHPYLIQLLCYEIVTLKNKQPPQQRRLANLSDVEAAIPHVFQHGNFYFADIAQNQISAEALPLLRLMAQQGEGALVSPEQIDAMAHPETALTQLLRRDLLQKTEDGYTFQVELIRRWFVEKSG